MTLRPRAALAAAAWLACTAAAGAATTAPSWQDGLLGLAAPDAHPTAATLGAVLAPFGATSPGCTVQPGAAPAHAPSVAAATLSVSGPCAPDAPVIRVQLLLQPVGTAAVTALNRHLRQVAGIPCFDGTWTPNPRRRAPPLHVLAWSGPGRDLILTQDSSVPDGVSVTFARNDLSIDDPRAMVAYAEQRDAAHHAFPASCRTAR